MIEVVSSSFMTQSSSQLMQETHSTFFCTLSHFAMSSERRPFYAVRSSTTRNAWTWSSKTAALICTWVARCRTFCNIHLRHFCCSLWTSNGCTSLKTWHTTMSLTVILPCKMEKLITSTTRILLHCSAQTIRCRRMSSWNFLGAMKPLLTTGSQHTTSTWNSSEAHRLHHLIFFPPSSSLNREQW